MQLKIDNGALIDALLTDDQESLKILKWFTGFNPEQLLEQLRQQLRAALNRSYENRRKLSELNVRDEDEKEYRRIDQLELAKIDLLRKQYNSTDSMVPKQTRTLQQFLRDYQ